MLLPTGPFDVYNLKHIEFTSVIQQKWDEYWSHGFNIASNRTNPLQDWTNSRIELSSCLMELSIPMLIDWHLATRNHKSNHHHHKSINQIRWDRAPSQQRITTYHHDQHQYAGSALEHLKQTNDCAPARVSFSLTVCTHTHAHTNTLARMLKTAHFVAMRFFFIFFFFEGYKTGNIEKIDSLQFFVREACWNVYQCRFPIWVTQSLATVNRVKHLGAAQCWKSRNALSRVCPG